MSELWSVIDSAVADALSAHPDYLTPKGQESARKMIVRKVTGALRDSMSAAKASTDEPDKPPVAFKAWSRDWWAILLHKATHGQPTQFMLDCAMKGYDCPAEPGIVAPLQSYPSDGEVMKAWAAWFKAHRVVLPEWRERVWVFLPGPTPEHGSTDPPNPS